MPREMISVKNRASFGRDVDLPQCSFCKIIYKLYECGHDFITPKWGIACDTCVQYRAEDKRPEPSTIPRIKVDRPERACGKDVCAKQMTLEVCQNPRGRCEIQFSIYACGHLKKEEVSHNCAGCGLPKNTPKEDRATFVPTTRPKLVIYCLYESDPKIEGVCDKYHEHERARRDRQERLQQELKIPTRKERYEQNQQSQYSSQPESYRQSDLGYPNIPDAKYRRPENLSFTWEPKLRKWQSQYGGESKSYGQSDYPNIPSKEYQRPTNVVTEKELAPPNYIGSGSAQEYELPQPHDPYDPVSRAGFDPKSAPPQYTEQSDIRRYTQRRWEQNQSRFFEEEEEERQPNSEAAFFEGSLPRAPTYSRTHGAEHSTSKLASKSDGREYYGYTSGG